MKLSSLVSDNISEVLVKILQFTQTRHNILTQNINNINSPGFLPRDLAVDEFSKLLNGALNEHVRCQRLMLRDTDNIKFGMDGAFEIKPIIDQRAKALLEEDCDLYLEMQINKLLENSLNRKVAAELLKQKQGAVMDL
jgi:flagellar basal body rod protein FlgB